MLKIKLQELAKAFALSETHTGYIDLEQGKVIFASSGIDMESNTDSMDMEEEEQMDQSIKWESDWQRYIALPNLGDYNFRDLLREFVASGKVNEEQQSRLLDACEKRAHERACMKLIRDMEITSAWEAFLDMYFLEVARDWCEENNVDYE